ncbi:MAG TPA: SoxR reducing system RseC family protein [Candidatus Wallbacteria bacterium]|nr:SoxR reducing system RseC family protein [Candidatus Wallbacteria bacterium]
MKEIGKVVNVEDGYIFVELKRNEFCSKCWRCMDEPEEVAEADDDDDEYIKETVSDETCRQVLPLKNEINAELYDRVEIEVSDNIFYVNLVIEFLMPLADFFIGYAAGYYFSIYMAYEQPETTGFFTAVVFFTLSYWLARVFSSDIMLTWNKYPKAVKIIRNAFVK